MRARLGEGRPRQPRRRRRGDRPDQGDPGRAGRGHPADPPLQTAAPRRRPGGDPFTVETAARSWVGPRRAGVSSFGLGGTNAHVLVQQAPSSAVHDSGVVSTTPESWTTAQPTAGDRERWLLLPLSAGDSQALPQLAGRLAETLATGSQRTPSAGPGTGTDGGDAAPRGLADVAYTLAVGRRRLPHRAAVLCRDETEARAGLAEVAAGGPGTVPDGAPEEVRRLRETWLSGGDVPAGSGRKVPLPGYPFQRRRHWIEPVAGRRG
ncbi:ketoacyl-synthetase C-terminal extension domain-containing protein [Catellatospora bangladeshensis]|uniref:CurL C-terminal domain-containing protein n=1 Tax=Catellatospora bangladeshensis TaxID=310355 RepID=UPI00361904EB